MLRHAVHADKIEELKEGLDVGISSLTVALQLSPRDRLSSERVSALRQRLEGVCEEVCGDPGIADSLLDAAAADSLGLSQDDTQGAEEDSSLSDLQEQLKDLVGPSGLLCSVVADAQEDRINAFIGQIIEQLDDDVQTVHIREHDIERLTSIPFWRRALCGNKSKAMRKPLEDAQNVIGNLKRKDQLQRELRRSEAEAQAEASARTRLNLIAEKLAHKALWRQEMEEIKKCLNGHNVAESLHDMPVEDVRDILNCERFADTSDKDKQGREVKPAEALKRLANAIVTKLEEAYPDLRERQTLRDNFAKEDPNAWEQKNERYRREKAEAREKELKQKLKVVQQTAYAAPPLLVIGEGDTRIEFDITAIKSFKTYRTGQRDASRHDDTNKDSSKCQFTFKAKRRQGDRTEADYKRVTLKLTGDPQRAAVSASLVSRFVRTLADHGELEDLREDQARRKATLQIHVRGVQSDQRALSVFEAAQTLRIKPNSSPVSRSLEASFAELDVNNDGVLNRAEVGRMLALQRARANNTSPDDDWVQPDQDEIDAAMQGMDRDGSNTVTREEFAAYCERMNENGDFASDPALWDAKMMQVEPPAPKEEHHFYVESWSLRNILTSEQRQAVADTQNTKGKKEQKKRYEECVRSNSNDVTSVVIRSAVGVAELQRQRQSTEAKSRRLQRERDQAMEVAQAALSEAEEAKRLAIGAGNTELQEHRSAWEEATEAEKIRTQELDQSVVEVKAELEEAQAALSEAEEAKRLALSEAAEAKRVAEQQVTEQLAEKEDRIVQLEEAVASEQQALAAKVDRERVAAQEENRAARDVTLQQMEVALEQAKEDYHAGLKHEKDKRRAEKRETEKKLKLQEADIQENQTLHEKKLELEQQLESERQRHKETREEAARQKEHHKMQLWTKSQWDGNEFGTRSTYDFIHPNSKPPERRKPPGGGSAGEDDGSGDDDASSDSEDVLRMRRYQTRRDAALKIQHQFHRSRIAKLQAALEATQPNKGSNAGVRGGIR